MNERHPITTVVLDGRNDVT